MRAQGGLLTLSFLDENLEPWAGPLRAAKDFACVTQTLRHEPSVGGRTKLSGKLQTLDKDKEYAHFLISIDRCTGGCGTR